MPEKKTYRFSRLLKISVAMLIAAGVLILSVSAVGNKDKERVADIKVNIRNSSDNVMLNDEDVMILLKKAAGKGLRNQSIGSLDLFALETQLKKHDWIKKAELYIDNSNVLRINIDEHKPVARVFTGQGNSFYLSEDAGVLSPGKYFVARVPVFTGFSGNPAKLDGTDSVLLGDIFTIADFVGKKDFWMSQIDQVDILPSGKFEMIPKLGNHIIRFGNAEDYSLKFSKLLSFYKQVSLNTGWNKYSVIDLQYKGQIVAEKRDASRIKADSLASVRIMKSIIENAKKNTNDSTIVQLPEKPVAEPVRFRTKQGENTNEVIMETIPGKIDEPVNSDNPHFSSDEAREKAGVPKVIPEVETKSATKKIIEEKKIPKAVMPSKK